MHHLGVAGRPEWAWFEGSRPEGPRYELRFPAEPNAAEQTLHLRQDDVKLDWFVELNGKRLGKLHPQEVPTAFAVAVPPGLLKADGNVLALVPPREPDDVRIGAVRLDPRPAAESVGACRLQVHVLDPGLKGGLPSRITIVDSDGFLPPLLAAPDQKLAVRPGCVYTADGHATVLLPPGAYTVHATRGPEYGLATRKVVLEEGDAKQVRLEIRREVSTPAWAACDTHLHTLQFSGHGDATADERALTLAGEGIELAVATEHNQHSAYQEAALRMGVRDHVTPVLGNEVTTAVGHFNVFPVAGDPVADWKLNDWAMIGGSIRRTPGVRVVILNHPRGKHSNFVPFAPEQFHPATGEHVRGPAFPFNAMELVNSGAQQSDFMLLYRDWFALLNRGHRITGVGSSDSHDVNRFIPGQARTYIQVNDADPGRIDVDAACEALLKGKALVSMGLFTQIKVNGVHGAGDLVGGREREIHVAVSVAGPSWAQVDRVELYANGSRIREAAVPLATLGGEKFKRTWSMPRPAHDVYYVAIASGPGIRQPYWPIPRPYQPDSKDWEPRVIGSTNPVWVDGDGDGVFTAPRGQAERLLAGLARTPEAVVPALAPFDEAVAAQAAGILRAAGIEVRGGDWLRALERSPAPVRQGFLAGAR
jgi:hypothetical protein